MLEEEKNCAARKVEKSVICNSFIPPRAVNNRFLPFQVNVSLEQPPTHPVPPQPVLYSIRQLLKQQNCTVVVTRHKTPLTTLWRETLFPSRQNFLKSHPLFAAFYSPPNRKSQRQKLAEAHSLAAHTKLFIKVDAATLRETRFTFLFCTILTQLCPWCRETHLTVFFLSHFFSLFFFVSAFETQSN